MGAAGALSRWAALLCALVPLVACAKSSGPNVASLSPPVFRDEATDWFLRSISADGRTIAIVYTISGMASRCQRSGHAFADESADKVFVIAYKSVNRAAAGGCTEELGYIDATVRLRMSLGRRALVGCRAGKSQVSEDSVCRDLRRLREGGFPAPSPSAAG